MTVEEAIIVLKNKDNYSKIEIMKAKRIIIKFKKDNEKINKSYSNIAFLMLL